MKNNKPATKSPVTIKGGHQVTLQPKPPKKQAGGKVSKAAKTFSVKAPRGRG